MTSETYQDSSYDRKGQKRPNRPKLLKLTDVSMPHRRKKTKTKVKERSQSNVRDRIYDDPAYTDDISHLAIPMRRSSGPDKIDDCSLSHKKKTSHKDNHFMKRSETVRYPTSDGSSSSDNMPPDPGGKHKRGQSLERANIIERSPKKQREKRDRSAKQKRNLSLDNTLSNSLRKSLDKSESSLKTASIERQKPSKSSKSMQRQNASESWSSCLAATSDSSKATENEESYHPDRKESTTKMQIGKRFLKGEIGIKSFNYYLLKEGLKSSKKFVDKQRNSLTKNDSKKAHSRSEENIYEEIFFVDKTSENEDHSKYPDCELCIQECSKENCEYCLEDLKKRQYFGSLGRNTGSHKIQSSTIIDDDIHSATLRGSGSATAAQAAAASTTAHILQYQSYNPNNPGVYKIETTPVAFTSDYNPIHQLQSEKQPPPPPPQRRFSRTGSQVVAGGGGSANRINTKSSSSSDSLHHHKYARDQSSQELYECNHPPMIYGTPTHILGPYDQKIYKSDSKVSIISEYSVRSESSTNRNFRCGEVSDSSLGDSMFSYSTQRRYFGSSESCRFAFECRRCSLDGEKCSFSDTCRYECRNCDCSSSYFSSDFDDYSRKNSTAMSNASPKSYEYYNDTIDVKQNKYAQDFIKHVNDVKRSIYQSELQRTTTTATTTTAGGLSGVNVVTDSYGTIPPPKQIELKKSMNHYQQQQTTRQYQHRPSRSGNSPFRIPSSGTCSNPSMMMKDVSGANRDNKNSGSAGGGGRTTAMTTIGPTMDKESCIKLLSSLSADDKILKYSEGKYAQPSTQQQQQHHHHHQSGDSGRQQEKKDSLIVERSQRRQTGAIPKLSSSSANSIHQSHQRNQRSSSNNNNSNKEITQRIPASGTMSPRSSPKNNKTTAATTTTAAASATPGSRNGSKDATTTTKIPAVRPIRIDQIAATSEAKKLITTSPVKSGGNQRSDSKDQVVCQDNRNNVQRIHSDGKCVFSENDNGLSVEGVDDNAISSSSNSQQQTTKDHSREAGLLKQLAEERQKKKYSGKSTVSDKKNFLLKKPLKWSNCKDEEEEEEEEEEGDDDVFIAANNTENVDDVIPAKRQRCFALPVNPPQGSQKENTSNRKDVEEKTIATTPTKSVVGQFNLASPILQTMTILSSPTTPTTTTTGAADSTSMPELTENSGENIKRAQTNPPQPHTRRLPSASSSSTTTTGATVTEMSTKKTAAPDGGSAYSSSSNNTNSSTHSGKAPTPILEENNSRAQQHLKKHTTSAADLSMKVKQQTVESVDKQQVPQKSDTVRGEIQEKSESSSLRGAGGSVVATVVTESKSTPPTAESNNSSTTGRTASNVLRTAVKSTDSITEAPPAIEADGGGGGGEVLHHHIQSTSTNIDAADGGAAAAAAVNISAAAEPTCAEEEISRESDVAVAGATFNRDSSSDKRLVEKEHKEEAIYLDENQIAIIIEEGSKTKTQHHQNTTNNNSTSKISITKIDFSDLPLPELPPKKRRNRTDRYTTSSKSIESSIRKDYESLENFQRYHPNQLPKRRESLESGIKTTTDLRKMHYHNLGHMTATAANPNSVRPTYLFGENRLQNSRKNLSTDEIYLNKSGWVQVNSKRVNNENSANLHNNRKSNNSVRLVENQNGSLKNSIRVIQIDNTSRDKPIYAVPKLAGSKIEELISRSEARRNNNTSRTYMKPGYKIVDPQIASILNERPGFLPVKTFADNDSPPPITPILSPPPAFQDTKTKYKSNGGNIQITTKLMKPDQKPNKGMVFSRSFEYDTRKPTDYVETFSKSFDSNLSEQKPTTRRDRSPNFSTLTGCSPNYLTKRESSSGRSRESSPKYQQVIGGSTYLSASNETPAYSNPKKLEKINRTSLDRNGRSRRAQFNRVNPPPPPAPPSTSRFRSFDANVNQRLNSCDSGARSDLSNDELDDEDDDNSTEFLSASYQPQSTYKQSMQRSLTPDKYDSLNSQKNLRKQRSITPESRSLTPEDRRKKGSQASLSSRQNSSSRSNTLERKQKFDDKSRSPSRSSSSSSYSGGEHEMSTPHRRSTVRNSKTPEEHRIRRSRSLQLSEKSPSRTIQGHKIGVCLTKNNNNQQPIYQQPVRSFPPTIRPDQIVTDQMTTANRNIRSDIDKSRSFDLDYGKYANQPVPLRLDFDKSRSFDEDYREHKKNLRYLTDTGIIRDDRNSLKPNLQRSSTSIPRQTSPQNYGTRLCDHELTYDMLRRTLDRSPIMDFSRDYDVPKPIGKNRDIINLSGNELNFLNERIYDHGGMKLRNPTTISDSTYLIDRLQKSRDSLTPDAELKSMRDTLNDERLRSGVADYIYNNRQQPIKNQPQLLHQHSQLQKQQQQRSIVDRSHQSLSGSSAPSRGSCTASSCDFWPHCGLTNLKTNKNTSVDRPNCCSAAAAYISDPANIGAASDEDDEGYIIVQDLEDKQDKTNSSGASLAKYSSFDRSVGSRPKYNRKSFSLIEIPIPRNIGGVVDVAVTTTTTTPRIKSKPPIYVNTTNTRKPMPMISSSSSSSVLFLGEREMPITRERDLQSSPTGIGMAIGNGKQNEKLPNRHGTAGVSSVGGDFRTSKSTELRRRIGGPSNKSRLYKKQRSISLPNVLFIQSQIPYLTQNIPFFKGN